jgi:glutathione S-transferase
MILNGMFDSPFVRRVAVSLRLLEVPFEHRNWSAYWDFELIRQFIRWAGSLRWFNPMASR